MSQTSLVFQVLKYANGRVNFSSLTEDEKRVLWHKNPVGYVTCPHCRRKKVLVCNQKGKSGSESDDYLVTHVDGETKHDCSMSRKTYFEILDYVNQ